MAGVMTTRSMLHGCVTPEHADPDPPALLAPPLSLTVPEGATSALFTCRVKGHPPPAVTWTREGTLLLTDHHYTVTSKGDTHSLEIVTPQKSDEGDYESHVHNIAGTVTGRCSLTVTEATATEASSCADTRNINSSQDVESSKRTGQSEHDKKGQRPDRLLDHAIPTSPSLSPTTDPSVSSTNSTTTTTTTSPTTQQSRGRSVGVLGRSPTWHSTVATPIRVGSVRKRRDWFEERASPSPPDRAPMGLRRSASSVNRHGQTALGDRASPGTPNRHRQTPLHDSTSPFDTDSRDLLAPAIYQIKTVPSSTENADKTKRQSVTTSLTSQPESAGERGSESYSPHTRESQTAESFIAELSGSRRQESHKHLSKPLSPETERNRTVQRKADSELLRPQSPGRMDFRSVLKPRQTESGSQQGGNTTEHQRTDFRSALKKATDKNSVVRRLFPDNGTQTADRQPLGGVGQSADRAKTDNVPRWRQHLRDAGQSVVGLLFEDSRTDDITLPPPDAARAMSENTTVLDTAEKQASFTTESETKQVVTSAPYTGTTTQLAAGTVSETPTEPTSPSHLTLTCAAKSDHLLQSSEQRYVTSAQMTIKLAAPDSNSRGHGGGGVSGEGCRKAEGEGGEREAPRLENQQECGGGQVVMRGAVSDHPQPQDSRTHNMREMQVVSPPVSSPVGERSCTVDSGRGQHQQQQPLSDPVRSDVTAPPVTGDVTSINTPDPELSSHCGQSDVVFVPGRKFEDFYDCGREVGRGKFGSVFECRAKQTGVTVAAKVLKVRGQGRREDVRREVEVMNTLSTHPSLLLLHDAFMADRTMVLVTEFVGGGELLERVCGEQYVLTERDCVHFLRQLCEGVAFMHSRGVLHLDLKPNNVLCLHPQSTRIKIIDFGLARFYKAGDSLRVLFGTPEFVAPEVISYDDISFATDMWSVGVVAYILLSGLSPFFGDTDAETLANVTQGDYDFDDDSFDVISDEAKDFISCLLLKRKEKRLSAEQCQRHAWLSRHRDSLKTRRLNTENLRSFVAAHRKRWHKTAQAIMAVQRMSSLSKIMPAHSKTTNGAHSGETAHS